MTTTAVTGRSVKLLRPLDENYRNGRITITQAGRRKGEIVTTEYGIARVTSDYGEAFMLDKINTTEVYNVLIDDDFENHICDCKDAEWRGRFCKHIKCIKALRDAGKLNQGD